MIGIPIQVKLLTGTAIIPTKGSTEAAGLDLYADLPDGSVTIITGDRKLIKCGFAMQIPEGYEAQVRSRSGLALKNGIIVLNAPGTIDSDYRGEVGVILYNASLVNFDIHHGDRIAQMVIARHFTPAYPQVFEELRESDRGDKGYGSTGLGRGIL